MDSTVLFIPSKKEFTTNVRDIFCSIKRLPNDVTIISADNEHIQTNRMLLSFYSPMMSSLLSASPGPSTIMLPQCSSKSIKNLLNIITKGFTQDCEGIDDTDDVNGIVEAGKLFGVNLTNLKSDIYYKELNGDYEVSNVIVDDKKDIILSEVKPLIFDYENDFDRELNKLVDDIINDITDIEILSDTKEQWGSDSVVPALLENKSMNITCSTENVSVLVEDIIKDIYSTDIMTEQAIYEVSLFKDFMSNKPGEKNDTNSANLSYDESSNMLLKMDAQCEKSIQTNINDKIMEEHSSNEMLLIDELMLDEDEDIEKNVTNFGESSNISLKIKSQYEQNIQTIMNDKIMEEYASNEMILIDEIISDDDKDIEKNITDIDNSSDVLLKNEYQLEQNIQEKLNDKIMEEHASNELIIDEDEYINNMDDSSYTSVNNETQSKKNIPANINDKITEEPAFYKIDSIDELTSDEEGGIDKSITNFNKSANMHVELESHWEQNISLKVQKSQLLKDGTISEKILCHDPTSISNEHDKNNTKLDESYDKDETIAFIKSTLQTWKKTDIENEWTKSNSYEETNANVIIDESISDKDGDEEIEKNVTNIDESFDMSLKIQSQYEQNIQIIMNDKKKEEHASNEMILIDEIISDDNEDIEKNITNIDDSSNMLLKNEYQFEQNIQEKLNDNIMEEHASNGLITDEDEYINNMDDSSYTSVNNETQSEENIPANINDKMTKEPAFNQIDLIDELTSDQDGGFDKSNININKSANMQVELESHWEQNISLKTQKSQLLKDETVSEKILCHDPTSISDERDKNGTNLDESHDRDDTIDFIKSTLESWKKTDIETEWTKSNSYDQTNANVIIDNLSDQNLNEAISERSHNMNTVKITNKEQVTHGGKSKPKQPIEPKKISECQCSICGEVFNSNHRLNCHIIIHMGGREKTFSCEKSERKCNICGKVFKNNSRLNRHKMAHTGEKPFTCEQCHKRFSRKDHLKQHQKTHSSET